MRERGQAIAESLQTSFTLGSGQFCTKPGVVFIPEDQHTGFERKLQENVGALNPFLMLSHGIAASYQQAVRQRAAGSETEFIAGKPEASANSSASCEATIFRVSLDTFLADPELGEEVFGPTTLLVHYAKESDLVAAASQLHGHLTATIHGTEQELARSKELIRVLETKVGRIIFNGFPTGVEVSHAMVHGGPFPATSDGRSTSVGTLALLRFVRPVCYQDFPDAGLPPELQTANPLGLMRLVNGKFVR
jgi:2,5-dioxopentanoate dehydrogenase